MILYLGFALHKKQTTRESAKEDINFIKLAQTIVRERSMPKEDDDERTTFSINDHIS